MGTKLNFVIIKYFSSHNLFYFIQANYFIAHPTSVTLILDSDDNIAYSALIIGAPTLAAIIVSMIHCHILSGYSTRKEPNSENIALFRYLLIFSCLSAIVGNIVQVYGIEHSSITLTVSENIWFSRYRKTRVLSQELGMVFIDCYKTVTNYSSYTCFRK